MKNKRTASPVALCAAAFSIFAGSCLASDVAGVVIDPTGRPIAGARVAVVNATGVILEQVTDSGGRYSLHLSPLYEEAQIRVAADGFQTTTVATVVQRIQMPLAPRADSVSVVGSAIDTPLAEQGSSVTVIGAGEIRGRNEGQAVDLLRQVPGIALAQSGGRGTLTSMFVRGGESKYNLVLLNGIPISSFYQGGLFDFAHVPADFLDEIDVARGPQSAAYGSYALASTVNFKTRAPEDGPTMDLSAEGGSHDWSRFAGSASYMLPRNWGLSAAASAMNGNGETRNGDYRNDNGFLALSHRWMTQSLFAFGNFDSNEVGSPGPWGSNPKGYFGGLDRISRSRNNTSVYGLHYRNDLADKLRVELITGAFLNNSGFLSPYGYSFSKDIRAHADARATWAVLSHWTMAGGYALEREEMRNTYVTDSTGRKFLLRRDNSGIYVENHFSYRNFFANAGLREEVYQTPSEPGNKFGYPPRPEFAPRTDTKLTPKISGGYVVKTGERIHASFGTGIRPPGGSDLAFTNNPALKPERTVSYDFGVEQTLLAGRLALDATWFHNDFKDLIVSAGGSLAKLTSYSTDNLANARTRGVETTARYRPSTKVSLTGSYTWLDTRVLSVNGGNGLVQQYYTPGQQLLRRPKQSGTLAASGYYKRLSGNVTGYFRGQSRDAEPNYGLSGGQYSNPGYANVGLNLNYRLPRGTTVYANVRNVLDRRYEEIFGYPAPLLNFVAGVKWNMARSK